MAAKIRKGDKVVVITGKDKGRTGEVLRILTETERAIVQGVRMVKRHTRPSQQNAQGGIIEKEAPIALSNLAHIDPKTNEPTRVGFKILDDGSKVRFAKRSGEVIDR
jgi:large subunit ribosomal protein L24